MNSEERAQVVCLNSVKFRVATGQVPSFKNRKMAVKDNDRPGKQKNITPPEVKARMERMENAIVSELFFMSQTIGGGTPSECSKRLRTFLSGLCDDSIQEIPCGEWDVEKCEPGLEGFSVEITEIKP